MEPTLGILNQTTSFEIERDSFGQVPAFIRIYLATLTLIAGVLGLVGNTMTFLAFAVSEKLQTKTNVFVVNLASADFVTSMLAVIIAWSGVADVDPSLPWINVLCAITIGIVFCSIGSSLLSLAFIALNRFILITKTKETYDNIFGVRNVTVFILITWFYPLSLTTIPLLSGVGKLGFDEVSHTCDTIPGHRWSHLYDMLVVCLLVPLPMAVITFSYLGIFHFVKRHNERIRTTRSVLKDTSQER